MKSFIVTLLASLTFIYGIMACPGQSVAVADLKTKLARRQSEPEDSNELIGDLGKL